MSRATLEKPPEPAIPLRILPRMRTVTNRKRVLGVLTNQRLMFT